MANHGERVTIVVVYQECRRNHALGGLEEVRDGCLQFEPSAPIGTLGDMVCAACHCHQNFHHRVDVELPRDNDDVPPLGPHQRRQARHSPSRGQESIDVTNEAPSSEISTGDSKPQHQGGQNRARLIPVIPPLRFPDMMVPRGREEVMESRSPVRTKRLTGPQSERLKAIARSNNWKMFREYSSEEVTEICSEIGIEKRCLKAWISYHRNERAIKQEVSN